MNNFDPNMVSEIQTYVAQNAAPMAWRFGTALFIVLAAWIMSSVAARGVQRVLNRREEKDRVATLAPVLRSLVRVAIVVMGLVMGLQHLGINVGALLAGAGVIGLAVGFGAQELVRDVISGFFMILDGVVRVSDIVDIDGKGGIVEGVGLRMTRVRSFEGKLWYVPNGQIKVVGNMSRDWMRAVVQVGVAYEQDVAQGLRVMQEVGDEWAAEHADIVIEPPEAQGVMGLNSSDVGLRLVVKVKAIEVWATERKLRAMVKARFDEKGVEIPFPRQVVYHRQDAASPAALPPQMVAQ